MAMNQSEGEDRLSALPDEIISEILSLLPFESVIATSALSRHWQRLSTQLSSLTFYPRYLTGSHKASLFWKSFNKFSSNLTSPLSGSLILHLHSFFFRKDCPCFSDSWFRQFCGSSVHTIKLTSDLRGIFYYHVVPSTLVFQMESLRVLELGGCFAWSLPSVPTTIRLPNLSKLSIDVVCYQFKLLGNLISSLPSLKDLSFWVNCDGSPHSHRNDHVGDHLSFSTPNLKRLYAKVYVESAVIVINAPVLESVKLTSHYKSRFYFVQKSGLLVEAALKLWDWSCACCDGILFNVLAAVSNVRSLVVKGNPARRYTGELTYPNLTTLVCKLGHWANIKMLDVLLKNCPVLQVVKLEVIFYCDDRIEEEWSFSNFMLTHVKIIELNIWYSHHRDMNTIKHLLSKAYVLEQFNINIIGGNSSRKWKAKVLQFFEGLAEYQEKLLRCHIEFSGFGVKLSCNGSKLLQELSSSSEFTSSNNIIEFSPLEE